MILHSMQVENWRCFLEKNEVGPFSDRVNILYAPNATGKSTLFEALRCALMDNHNTKGEDVSKLRPWGRELSPRVMVEFSVGGSRYRVKKSFLDKPGALLERLEDGEFRSLAEGPKADAMTRNLFTRDAPKKGMSRPEHWGILQVLWAPQGRLELGDLSGNLLADIRQSLSAQTIDDRTRGIEKRLSERYGLHFTPTGRKRDSGTPAKLNEKKEELEACMNDFAVAESLSAKVKALSGKLGNLRAEVERLRSESGRLEARAKEYEVLKGELEKRLSDTKIAETEYGRLKAEIDRIIEAREEKDSAQRRLSELDALIPNLDAQLQACRADLDRATHGLEAAKKERNEADESLRQSGEARRFVELCEKLAALAEKITAVGGVQESLSEHERGKGTGVFPDPSEIKKIRKAYSDFEKAKIRLESSLITLEIVPAVSCSGQIEAGDVTGPASFEAGKAMRLQGTPEVRVEVESFGRIRAFGPSDSAEEARENLEKAERQLEKLTARFEKTEKPDIEDLFEDGLSLDRHIERERAELKALLGSETLEELRTQREAFGREVDEILARYPEWSGDVPDAKERMRAAAERKALAEETLRAADESREAANVLHSGKDTELSLAREKKKNEERRLASVSERLAKLESDGRTPEQRQTDLERLLMTWDSANGRAEEYRKRIREFGENPVTALDEFRKTLLAKEQDLKVTNDELIHESAVLDTYSARGLYSSVAALEESVAELEKACEKEALDSESIRLLFDTFSQCRSELSTEVTRRAAEKASEIFTRIVGSSSGRLELADSLKPTGFIPRGTERLVDVDSLSGGEKEQLHFSVRMALAAFAGGDERQLLVLDDTFMATDAVRFPRILDIIDEAAAKLQILILTCHPGRFSALSGAKHFDLAGVQARSA